MEISSDYKDLLITLNEYKVKYLVVGAYAVSFYTQPRFTKDLDIWVQPTEENSKKIYQALIKFGAPLRNVSSEDFTNRKLIYQIGVAPVRIDIIMQLPSLKFEKAWENRRKIKFADVQTNIIGIEELIIAKQELGRDQDILDVKNLKKALESKDNS